MQKCAYNYSYVSYSDHQSIRLAWGQRSAAVDCELKLLTKLAVISEQIERIEPNE